MRSTGPGPRTSSTGWPRSWQTGYTTPLGFTTAYFHTPDGLAAELVEAGLSDVAVRAVEGPLGYAVDLAPESAQGELIARAARTAQILQDDPSAMGTSPHALAMGRVPPAGV
jgi:hypothetical protein